MDRRLRKYLSDILSSILEIEYFMMDRPKEYATFCNDILFRRGVERNIEIMGEAMKKPDILWGIVVNHMPLLKQEVEYLLKGQ